MQYVSQIFEVDAIIYSLVLELEPQALLINRQCIIYIVNIHIFFQKCSSISPAFVAYRHFHMVNSRLCLVCRNHRGRSRRLCRLCNRYRACPGCIPERCWIAFQGNDGACKDCFVSFLIHNLERRLTSETVMLVVEFL